MRGGLIAIALLAACSGGQGVDIEVHQGSSPIDSVELWIAYGTCHLPDGTTECDGIGWPGAQLRPTGTVFTLGDDEKLIRTDVIVDGVAQLHLEAAPGNNTPAVIAVIGYKGTEVVGGALIGGADIPLSGEARWRIELDDLGQVTADTSTDPGNAPWHNALVWDRKPSSTLPDASGYTGCLAYQKWKGDGWETLYFVPPSDPDCDGDPPDCNPYWYNASVANARCVTSSPSGILANVCTVGNLMCKGEMDRVGCTTQTTPLICVGEKVCSVCGDSPDLTTCLKAQVPATITPTDMGVPMQACQMLADQDGPCVNNSGINGWQATFSVPGGACAPNAMSETIVLRPIALPFIGGMSTITVNGATITAHATPVTSGGGVGCQVELTWTVGNATDVGIKPIIAAISYGPGRQILFPLLLDFQRTAALGQCPTPNGAMPCTPLGSWGDATLPGDTMFKCTN